MSITESVIHGGIGNVLDLTIASPVDSIKAKLNAARSVSSPILLDLDGDGIETTAATAGAYFDHAGDGFADLRVWKDANGDGLSQAGELFTLADAGVQSLTTAYSQSTAVDAHGNAHKQIGGYTRTDGSRRISRAGIAGNAKRLSARPIPFGKWSNRFPLDYPATKFQYA